MCVCVTVSICECVWAYVYECMRVSVYSNMLPFTCNWGQLLCWKCEYWVGIYTVAAVLNSAEITQGSRTGEYSSPQLLLSAAWNMTHTHTHINSHHSDHIQFLSHTLTITHTILQRRVHLFSTHTHSLSLTHDTHFHLCQRTTVRTAKFGENTQHFVLVGMLVCILHVGEWVGECEYQLVCVFVCEYLCVNKCVYVCIYVFVCINRLTVWVSTELVLI